MRLLHLAALLTACVLAPAAAACSATWWANGATRQAVRLPAPGLDMEPAEIVRSPSGMAFALNAGDGGVVGTWNVRPEEVVRAKWGRTLGCRFAPQ